MLSPFLHLLEDIAVFWKEGTLIDNHVKEFFAPNVKMASGNDVISAYIEERSKSNPEYTYVNLKKLFKKVEDWGI